MEATQAGTKPAKKAISRSVRVMSTSIFGATWAQASAASARVGSGIGRSGLRSTFRHAVPDEGGFVHFFLRLQDLVDAGFRVDLLSDFPHRPVHRVRAASQSQGG